MMIDTEHLYVYSSTDIEVVVLEFRTLHSFFNIKSFTAALIEITFIIQSVM